MTATKHLGSLLLVCVLGVLPSLGGCRYIYSDAGFLDPSRRWKSPSKDQSPINPILTSMTYADPADEILPNATPPTREDLIVTEKDYVIGPNDVLEIRILDLFVQGQEIPLQRQVSETGFIRLPLIPELVRASGYTKELLREKIADFYDPDILIDPTISIATLVRHQNTFSIVGAIQRTGTYSILRPDMRLLEALALAGGIYQPTIRYIYVLRQQPSVRMEEAPPAPPEAVPPAPPPEEVEETEAEKRQRVLRELEKALEELAPEAPQEEPVEPGFLPLLTEMASGIAPRAESPEGTNRAEKEKSYKLVYKNDKFTWVTADEGLSAKLSEPTVTSPAAPEAIPGEKPVAEKAATTEPVELQTAETQPAIVPPTTAPIPEETATRPSEPTTAEAQGEIIVREPEEKDPFGWKEAARADQARVIAINLRKLKSGDDMSNIMIRDKDTILIPELEVGEFYIAGEVLRPGVYSLTGRKITLKQAVAAAGNLSPLAWPKNALLVRRIGDYEEQASPLDLDAIMQGEEPDFYLKPDDFIAVGSHAAAPIIAVVRNAFRVTYGFGFIYDRNFADPIFGAINSKRFKRW